MTINDDSKDIVVAHFINSLASTSANTNPNNGSILSIITTSYHIEKDFFNPVDSFSIEIEDDRADQLIAVLSVGMTVKFDFQSGATILLGFVDGWEITPKRQGGKRLSIRGRDYLGLSEDASIYPNLGDKNIQETYQFQETDTLEKVVKTIFSTAPLIDPNKIKINNDFKALQAQTGFGVGVRQISKKGRGLAKSFKSNLNRLLKPEKAETYLGYAKRICNRIGCQIKAQPGDDSPAPALENAPTPNEFSFGINIGPPTYDRTNQPSYTLNRFQFGYDKNNPSLTNNILDSKLTVNYKDQPSVIIAEGSHGGPTFKKVTRKIICLNEMTAWLPVPNQQLTLDNAIQSVKDAVSILTSGTSGYKLMQPNQELYNAVPSFVANMQTAVSRPKYVVDYNSQNDDELEFYVSELMAHYQQQFFTLEYEVQGHSQNIGGQDVFWAPNLMVKVYDESFNPTKPIDGFYWIKKVEFVRDRHNGSLTRLTLCLPYTHIYAVPAIPSVVQQRGTPAFVDNTIFPYFPYSIVTDTLNPLPLLKPYPSGDDPNAWEGSGKYYGE